MREFQRVNKINGQCITNTQFLYDTIKASFPNIDVKAQAVIAVDIFDDTFRTTIHLIISADGEYYEPSYEVFNFNARYYSTIKDFIKNNKPPYDNPMFIKDAAKSILPDFMRFIKYAEQINEGDIIITDKDFYNKQADYIEYIYS